jgi:hypothetical protein
MEVSPGNAVPRSARAPLVAELRGGSPSPLEVHMIRLEMAQAIGVVQHGEGNARK